MLCWIWAETKSRLNRHYFNNTLESKKEKIGFLGQKGFRLFFWGKKASEYYYQIERLPNQNFLIKLIIQLVTLLCMPGKNVSTLNKITFAAINPAIIQSKYSFAFANDNMENLVQNLYQSADYARAFLIFFVKTSTLENQSI